MTHTTRTLTLTVAFLAAILGGLLIGSAVAHAEPGPVDHPTGDPCEAMPDAPFCGGPSLRECPGGGEVPETDPCPGNDVDAVGDPDPDDDGPIMPCVAELPDEHGDLVCVAWGHPDDYWTDEVEIGEAVAVERPVVPATDGPVDVAPQPAAAAMDELPETGFGTWVLAMIAAVLIGGGIGLIARD